uniref:N/A n=1 Tax=Ganoderma boninense TaxID=34458 RepID=A0A5K1K422_9APHY|nr:N/A [Ganoderma boninense]
MRGPDSFSDAFIGETMRGMIRGPLGSAPAAVPARWSERQPGSSSVHDCPVLSPGPPPQQAQSSQGLYRVSFVPSSDAPPCSAPPFSGFHTPSVQDGSSPSSAKFSSPSAIPASASSSSAPRYVANPSSNAKLHGILEEPQFAEEPAIDCRRHRHASRSTEETETIRLQELMGKEDSPAVPTRLTPHPPRVELAFVREGGLPPLRSESLSPSGNWKGEWSAPLGGLALAILPDPINDPEEGSPYTPCTPEFAHPSEYSPKSIDFPGSSVDSPSPIAPSFSSPPHVKFTPSPSLSPLQHAEPQPEKERDHCTWLGVRRWRRRTPLSTSPRRISVSASPALAPTPLSPVVSVHSEHSITNSIRSSITRLFRFGGGGRSRSRSRSAGPAGAEQTRSSDSFHWVPPLPSTISTVSLGSVGMCEGSNNKVEERRLRKEAAKARTERMAKELAEKARRRAEEDKARTVGNARDMNLRPWKG